MERTFRDLLMDYRPPSCPLHDKYGDHLHTICMHSECPHYFQALCAECNEDHDHSARYLQNLKKFIEKVLIAIDYGDASSNSLET